MKTLLFAFLISLSFAVNAEDVTLAWDAPTTNDDGSPLTDLTNFTVFQRDFSGSFDFSSPIATLGPTTLTYDVTGLVPGHYVWVVLAVNSVGLSSYASNEAGKVITAPLPGQPEQLHTP
jgi:hypothetical protein